MLEFNSLSEENKDEGEWKHDLQKSWNLIGQPQSTHESNLTIEYQALSSKPSYPFKLIISYRIAKYILLRFRSFEKELPERNRQKGKEVYASQPNALPPRSNLTNYYCSVYTTVFESQFIPGRIREAQKISQ